MNDTLYQFCFDYEIDLDDAEILLRRAIIAAEGLLGRVRVLLKAGYRRDVESHSLYVDGAGDVGQAVTQIFTAFLIDAWGTGSFSVSAATRPHSPKPLAMAG